MARTSEAAVSTTGMTEPTPLQQLDRTYVQFRGRRLSYFSGCDYFRLSSHPSVLRALRQGIRQYGLNVAASRLTTGNHKLYRELEQQLARFFRAPDALLVSSGYMTNLVAAQALAGSFSQVLLDERSHPSLVDATKFLDCPVRTFKHRSPEDLARMVRRGGTGARIILLTDGMFSQDGSVAPLDQYRRVLPQNAQILVDDAHGAGVLGRQGHGTLEHVGISRNGVIQTLTLSKAFGVYGGAILGTAALRQLILDRSQCVIGSTPPPLPLINAARQSLRIVANNPALRNRLTRNQAYVKGSLRRAGIPIPENPGPILAFRATDETAAARVQRALLTAGIYPPFIRYPGGPQGGGFRFALSSEHKRQQLEDLVDVILANKSLMVPL